MKVTVERSRGYDGSGWDATATGSRGLETKAHGWTRRGAIRKAERRLRRIEPVSETLKRIDNELGSARIQAAQFRTDQAADFGNRLKPVFERLASVERELRVQGAGYQGQYARLNEQANSLGKLAGQVKEAAAAAGEHDARLDHLTERLDLGLGNTSRELTVLRRSVDEMAPVEYVDQALAQLEAKVANTFSQELGPLRDAIKDVQADVTGLTFQTEADDEAIMALQRQNDELLSQVRALQVGLGDVNARFLLAERQPEATPRHLLRNESDDYRVGG